MWANFSSMPKLLKLLTANAAFCFVFFAMSVIPNGSLSIQGRHVGYAEWWSSGAGVLASLIGLVGPFVAWALASKQPYARCVFGLSGACVRSAVSVLWHAGVCFAGLACCERRGVLPVQVAERAGLFRP